MSLSSFGRSRNRKLSVSDLALGASMLEGVSIRKPLNTCSTYVFDVARCGWVVVGWSGIVRKASELRLIVETTIVEAEVVS